MILILKFRLCIHMEYSLNCITKVHSLIAPKLLVKLPPQEGPEQLVGRPGEVHRQRGPEARHRPDGQPVHRQ